MCSCQITFIRHTETVANVDEVRQGHLDYPITERGCVKNNMNFLYF